MTNFNNLTEHDKEILLKAIDSLLERNPELPKQLTKLAGIKQATPLIWKMMLHKLGV